MNKYGKWMLLLFLGLFSGIIGAIHTAEAASSVTDEYNLEIVDSNYTVLKEGEEYTLDLTVVNRDNATYFNNYFSLTFDSEDAPVYFTETDNMAYLETLHIDKEYTIQFHIKVDSGSPGVYGATLHLSGVSGTASSNIEVSIDKSLNFVVQEVTSNTQFYGADESQTDLHAGDTQERDIAIYGEQDQYASNIVVTLTSEEEGLSIQNTGVVYNPVFKDGKTSIPLTIKASSDLESGDYLLDGVVEFEDSRYEGKTFERDFTIPITVEDDEDDIDLQLSPLKATETSITVDGETTITASVTNNSASTLDQAQVDLSYDDAIVPLTQDAIELHNLEPGVAQEVSFTLKGTDASENQSYSVGMTVTAGEDFTTTQYIGIYVDNPDADDEDDEVSTPRLMITDYNLGTDQLYSGDDFTLNFTVENTSSSRTIQNVKLEVSAGDDSVFLPTKTGTAYIDTLAPKESQDVSVGYSILSDAEGGIYSMTVTYDYEDADNNSYSDSETLNVPVYQEEQLTISDVAYGSVLDSGFTLQADFYNTGKVDIDNLMVDIELDQDYQTEDSNYYVGTFESGRTDIYDVEITGSQPNYLSGTLIFTYDDTFGKSVEVDQPFELGEETTDMSNNDSESSGPTMGDQSSSDFSSGGPSMGGGGGNRDTRNPSESSIKKIAIIAGPILGIVIIAIIVIVIVRKRRFRKADNK